MKRLTMTTFDPPKPHGNPSNYLTGFGLSVGLTLVAYFLVTLGALPRQMTIIAVLTLAIAQLFVQLHFFLHLGRESKPRLNLLSFAFMLIVVVIVVFGTLWIMQNLNYHTRSPEQMDTYMRAMNKKGF